LLTELAAEAIETIEAPSFCAAISNDARVRVLAS